MLICLIPYHSNTYSAYNVQNVSGYLKEIKIAKAGTVKNKSNKFSEAQHL